MGLAMYSGLTYTFSYSKYEDASFKVFLTRMNDNMNPDTAKANVEALLKKDDRPFMIVGEVGTTTSLNVKLATVAGKVPFIGPACGAQELRFPFERSVINIRASVRDEISSIVDYLMHSRKVTSIGILQQNDKYGEDARKSLDAVLETAKLTLT
jgi:ABC-type branched-subunit amino acid transport system substrate-binding protein